MVPPVRKLTPSAFPFAGGNITADIGPLGSVVDA
jgi:hypothetical protein